MGETPIILLPVVAPEPHMKSRTPSDSAIVAIFRDKRKPQNAARSAFPLDFMGIFRRYGGVPGLLQGGLRRLRPAPDKQGQRNSAPTYARTAVLCVHESSMKSAALVDRF